MAAALEVSYLYRGWSSTPLDDANYTGEGYDTSGYMDTPNWNKWVGEDQNFVQYFKRDKWPPRAEAGDLIVYTARLEPGPDGDLRVPSKPAHIIVRTSHGDLCFEKQGTGSFPPNMYYQLRPCGRGEVYNWAQYNEDYYSPMEKQR